MTRTSPPQVAFSSGELDPLLARRFDYQRYQTGLGACKGFIPLPQGGVTRQPGTLYRGNTAGDAAAILIPFTFAANDALILEMTAGKMRVWRYGALVMNGAAPYELATPFDATSLANLKWVQSADVLYLADGLRPIQRLARFALNNWTISAQPFLTGPFRAQNLDKAKTLQASATSGAIMLTANTAFFQSGHIGSLILLRPTNMTGVPIWTSNTDYGAGAVVRVGARIYQQASGATRTTANDAPIHEDGTQNYAGDIAWTFLSDDMGIARIDSISSATVANATVLRALPPGVKDSATYRWAESAWNGLYGYPSAIELYEQRLVAAATPSEPRTVWFSTVGAYDDFTPDVEADSSFAYTLAGSGSINRIVNLARGRSGLHVFALGEEYSVRSENRGTPIGPATAVFGLDGSNGVSSAAPIAPNGDPIVISRDRRRVLTVSYSMQDDANRVAIMSRSAQHLGAQTFDQIVWQQSPEPMAWLRRGNGEAAVMIYDPSEEVLGWARASFAGGFVEAMAVTADATGRSDVLTFVVKRMINGQVRRFIEELAPSYGNLTGEQPIDDAVHFFAASQFAPSVATANFSVPHLAGQTVYAWTDQGDFGPITVAAGGAITLGAAVTSAVIGLFDDSHYLETLDITAAAPDGNAMGRQKRLHGVSIGLHRTAQAEIATVERSVPAADVVGNWAKVINWPVAASLTRAISGVIKVDLPSGNAKEQMVRMRPYNGAPMTVTAIVPLINQAG